MSQKFNFFKCNTGFEEIQPSTIWIQFASFVHDTLELVSKREEPLFSVFICFFEAVQLMGYKSVANRFPFFRLITETRLTQSQPRFCCTRIAPCDNT